jgi:hypothetical protein
MHALTPAHVTLLSDNPIPVSLRQPQIPQATPCGISGGQSGFFFPSKVLRFSPVSIIVPILSTHIPLPPTDARGSNWQRR